MAARRPNDRPNPRGQNSPGGMPQVDQRMPHSGQPNARRTNVGFGGGRGMGTPYPPQHQKPATGQPDYFSQLNAFQPDISGQQPGPIAAGWGGAGGSLDTMGMTKVNSWLNTFQDPTQRAQAMNGIGYFNQGNPYTPEAGRGVNRGYRGMAQGNQAAGAQGYSAPGTYLHQSSYEAGPGGAPNMNFGGYIGATNVQPGGAAQYTPFDRNFVGGGAPAGPRPNPRPINGPGGMPNQGVPGGGGGGGGQRPNPRGQNSQGGKPKGGGKQGGNTLDGRPGGGNPGGFLGFPQTPPAPPGFLPMTPEYEAARRGLDDSLMGTLQGLQNQQNLVSPAVGLASSRLATDQGYDTQRLMEDLANRGIVGSGAGSYLYGRDIGVPYGREYQDLALGAAGQYGDLMGQTGEAYHSYDSAMIEALLNRAAQAAQDMPLSLPSTYPPKGTKPYKRPSKRARRRNRGKKK